MDFVASAKNIATVLGAASSLAYISGYLALRARAHVLGTDPGFKLVDEAYVFAGFRFVFITLMVLLVATPMILLVRWGVLWTARQVPASIVPYGQWSLLVLVAFATIVSFQVLRVSGALLQPLPGESSLTLQAAVLGIAPSYVPVLSTIATVLLLALSVLWLQARPAISAWGPFEWVLGIAIALQTCMLPIYHGALFADRKVRVLATMPDMLHGIKAPLGIVDRTSAHATLLGRDAAGHRTLATVKLDDLNGIAIERIVSIETFLADLTDLTKPQKTIDEEHRTVNRNNPQKDTNKPERPPDVQQADVERSFFTAVTDYLKMTFTAAGSLGESPVEAGQLWAVSLDSAGNASNLRRIGSFDKLAWPVAASDGTTIYALEGKRLVRLDADGRSTHLCDDKMHWRKLIGVASDGAILGLVFEDGETKPAILDAGGAVQVVRTRLSDADSAHVARLLQETHAYTGDRILTVDRSERGGRGFDVFLKSQGKKVNLSDCGDDDCGQPSMRPDMQLALFIKEPRY